MSNASVVIVADWEIRNIGKSTIEIQVSETDNIILDDLEKYKKSFDYIVVKVPLNNHPALTTLNAKGFVFNEMQMAYEHTLGKVKNTSQFDAFVNKAHLLKVNTNEQLNTLLVEVNPGMFHTDRVALNPMLGPELAANRYRNWISTEFESGRSNLYFIESNNMQILGFAMFRVLAGHIDYLLGGIFPKYQNFGFGPQIVIQPLAFAKAMALDNIQTYVSSNNPNVIKLYQYFGFQLNLPKSRYVFSHIH